MMIRSILLLLVFCALTACRSTETEVIENPEPAPVISKTQTRLQQKKTSHEAVRPPPPEHTKESPNKKSAPSTPDKEPRQETPEVIKPVAATVLISEKKPLLKTEPAPIKSTSQPAKATFTPSVAVEPTVEPPKEAPLKDPSQIKPKPLPLKPAKPQPEAKVALPPKTNAKPAEPTQPLPEAKLIPHPKPNAAEPIEPAKEPEPTPKPQVTPPPQKPKPEVREAPTVKIPEKVVRPAHLTAKPIPFDIKFEPAPDAEVIQAAKLLQDFLEERAEPSTCGGDLLMVYAGAWNLIQNHPKLKSSNFDSSYFVLQPNGKTLEVEGALAMEPKDVAAILSSLKQIIGRGSRIRAIDTIEMAEWWSYTGEDIEEPLFVVEPKGRDKQYLFIFKQGKIALVDELDALPDVF